MKREGDLYLALCLEYSVDELSDEDIRKIVSVLKGGLGELDNPPNLSLGEIVHIDANVS